MVRSLSHQLPPHFLSLLLRTTAMTPIATQTVRLDDDAEVFYRSAGPVDAPVLLALHGFPTSSFQYRYLIEGLKSDFRVIVRPSSSLCRLV